ncbi:BRO1 domain, ALIX V-shaped domain protein [Artemisia annua]|uniref:BRO1 domain, ALIX V-shaped domain protein n=1 Tax=Artemisia annua TaxID=35608 RepID=A0A2U1KGE0_ARTAN|nr:BRO1 domain, ALIX V-shaped domain protein [Artemisia annua]
MATPSSPATNTMLTIPEKKTTATNLYNPLRTFIVNNYSQHEAQTHEDDLQTLNSLRTQIQNQTNDRDVIVSYYKALTAVESRFPIGKEENHARVSFTWYDAFKTRSKVSEESVQFEKSAVLFNLGAVSGKMAVGFERGSVEGRREAVKAFVYAAGVFGFLKENVSGKGGGGGGGGVDVGVECVGMLEKVMLAQGQECVFENALVKGSSHSVCAKIARQVGLYYEEAAAALNVAPLSQHFDKTWTSHIQLKAALYYAEACYRYSLELHEKDEIGEEIARLKSGITALTDAKKSAPRGAPQQILDAINKLEINLNANLDTAMKENDRVYLMRVPPASSLAPLPAISLVKSMDMTDVLDASKDRMFASLVPDGSAKALSRYTEMVDDVIRTQAEKLQQGSELARVHLKEMNLPDSILALEGHAVLPTALWEDVEAVQVSGGPAGLQGELQQLQDLRRVNHELVVQTEELIQKEAAEDAQFRTQFGTRWTRPQSSTLTKNLQDRLNRFAANLKQAADSDGKVERSMRDNMALMSILDSRPIESALPTLARPIMSLDANEDAIVGALKQSLTQLETLGAQRAGLEDMLKDMKRKDDILPKMMAMTGSYEDLFRKEISKYDHICEEISQNLQAQDQLLLQIQAQNNQFASTFNIEEYRASCEKCYKQIEAAVAKYREIKENINEGLKFYVTLQEAITNIKQQASDFAMTRSIQCRDMIEDVQRQMSGLGVQDGRNSSSNNYSSQSGPTNTPNTPRPQTPYYHHPPQSGYAQHPQQPPPYHMAPPGGPPYPTQQGQQPGPSGPQYGQPGWQNSYYNPQGRLM